MMYGKPPMGYRQPPGQYQPGPMPPQPPMHGYPMGQYQPGPMGQQFGIQNALAMGRMPQHPQGYNALAFGRMR
jgi:hypothetical protein